MRAGEHVTPQVRLVRPIGAGGMGAVWVAEHLALKTEVAVKFILAGREQDSEARERFSREAEAAAQVKSPHVTQIFDHGLTEDGVPFIVMEMLEGEDLARYLHTHHRLPLREVSAFVTQICRALGRAHARGLIHRDVKPANIFLCDVGTSERFVKLLDFGVAKMVGDSSTATKSGSLTGTPVYMAPEQLLGARDLDHRADLWSVAVVAYEMMVGRRPLNEENAAAIGVRLHTRGMPRPSDGLPELTRATADALDKWFAKAWAIDPKQRFDTALALAEEFEVLVRSIYEGQGVEPNSGKYFLPIRQGLRAVDGDILTIRDSQDAAISDVTLASGRLQIAEPLAATVQAPPSQGGPLPLHTETPLSKQVPDPLATQAPAERSSKRSPMAAFAAVAVAIVAIGAVTVLVRSRGSEPPKEAGSASGVQTTATAPPVASPVASTSASAIPAPSVSAAQTAAVDAASAAPKPSTTAPAIATVKKPPVAASAASVAPTVKKLEDIE